MKSDPAASALARQAKFHTQVSFRRQALRETLARELSGVHRLTLEVGCGHGHWLAAYAARHRERFCLGFDLLQGRVEKAVSKLERAGLGHARVIKAEAVELLEEWPSGPLLDQVFILYSDPWPKCRHHKNRVLQPSFLELVAGRCVPGARLHFRTDHEEYGEWARVRMGAHPRWRMLENEPWPFEQETVFERVMGGPKVSLIAEVR